MKLINEEEFDLVITDLVMKPIDGDVFKVGQIVRVKD